jgi:hypothetical protein
VKSMPVMLCMNCYPENRGRNWSNQSTLGHMILILIQVGK